MSQHHKAGLLEHARRHYGGLGALEIKNGHMGAYGVFEATIVLTTTTERIFFAAYHGGGALGMTEGRREPLEQLPLFAN